MRTAHFRKPLLWALGAAALSGCYEGVGTASQHAATDTDAGSSDGEGTDTDGGESGDGGSGGGPEALCDVPKPGGAPIRRLTRTEYNNTLRDLLGDDSAPAKDFAGEDVLHGFDNAAAGGSMSRLLAEQYETAANEVAGRAVEDLVGLLGCDPATDEDACIDSFIEDFGRRAYRQPLSAEQWTRLRAFYDEQRAQVEPGEAVSLLLAAMLQSPSFLYRVEMGEPDLAQGGAVPLTDWEVATRLSYLLWNTIPDDALFDAAQAGQLRTSDQIAGQAQRMLADPRSHDVVLDFHEQWLSLRGNVPEQISELGPLLREESRMFITTTLLEGDGKLDSLLTAKHSYMNKDLADHYGIDSDNLGDDFERVDLDPQRRSGLLTQGLLLAIQAEEHESSPIKRGRLVREQLLCFELPAPDPDVMVELPEVDPNKTTRERYAQHREDPACAGCHVFIDPLGFGFEHYDQFGVWREEENNAAVDASGELTGVVPVEQEGPYYGAVELAERIAETDTFKQCAVDNWFRYAYGREQLPEDDCTVEFLESTFEQSNGNVPELILALTKTDAFRFRPAIEGGE